MQFLDVEIRIAPQGEGYQVTLEMPGEDVVCERIPSLLENEDFRSVVDQIDRVTRSGHTRDAIPLDDDDEQLETINPVIAVRTFGKRLFESVFVGEILASYRSALAIARKGNQGLRLRLHLNAPEVAALPWEFLYDESEGDYVCLLPETPIVRYVDLARESESITVEPPLRILAMTASPDGLPKLHVERERKQMEDAIEHLIDNGTVELEWLEGETREDLHQALREAENEGKWHIFHFIGHGGFDPEREEGFIALADENRQFEPLSATRLARILAEHQSIRMTVLNCCEGAKASDTNLFSSAGAVLTRRDIPAVVSMQYKITDDAAIKLSRSLYDHIADGKPVEESLQKARVEISLTSDETIEWATPVLYMRSPDGQLFDIDLGSAVFRNAPVVQVVTNIQNTGGSVSSAPAPAVRSRDLSILLSRMKARVDELLGSGFQFDSQIIGLHMERLSESSKKGDMMHDAVDLTAFFESHGGSILLLGDPGSGKSTSLLTLARNLIARAEVDSQQAVPVIVRLSSWDGEPVLDWVIDQLRVDFTYPPNIIRELVESNQLLFLLDGLDEVAEKWRAKCVDAINEFAPLVGLAGIAVTCRTREYLNLPNRLAVTEAIKIKGLERENVVELIEHWGDEYAGLVKLLRQDSALQILGKSPLMLGLMAEVYRGMPVDDVDQSTAQAGATTRRDALMEKYVEKMFSKSGVART